MSNQTTKTKTNDLSTEQTKTMNGLPTKSAKIRYLHSQGMTTGQIAKVLDIRYQHARNVLTQPLKRPV